MFSFAVGPAASSHTAEGFTTVRRRDAQQWASGTATTIWSFQAPTRAQRTHSKLRVGSPTVLQRVITPKRSSERHDMIRPPPFEALQLRITRLFTSQHPTRMQSVHVPCRSSQVLVSWQTDQMLPQRLALLPYERVLWRVSLHRKFRRVSQSRSQHKGRPRRGQAKGATHRQPTSRAGTHAVYSGDRPLRRPSPLIVPLQIPQSRTLFVMHATATSKVIVR